MKLRTRATHPTSQGLAKLEVRDPSAATAALQFSSPGHAQVDEWDAAAAIRLAYLSNVFVYRCVEVVAKSLAALPWRMGQDPDKPNDYNRNHPLAKLLGPAPGGPAPGISARQLWAWSTAQRLVTGKIGWEIERGSKDQPIAFWPLASSWLSSVPSKAGTSYFAGFIYGQASDRRNLKPQQIWYHWNPSLADWRQPESVLQAARLDVSVAVMQDRYDFAFLRNDARPASVVVHQAFAERDERDAWREKFLGEHMGPDNAGRVGFVEVDADDGQVTGMLDIKTLGLSQRDAEFINRYNSKIRGICVAFGVPLSILGDASGRTFSNADAEERFFWSVTMRDLVNEIEDAVNIGLASEWGDSLVGWFDLSKVRALEPVKKPPIIDLVKAVEDEIFSADEIRAATLDLPPKPNGTGGFRQALPVPAPVPVPVPVPTKTAASAPKPEYRDIPVAPPVPLITHEERRRIIYRAVSRNVRALERVWERQWRAMFRRQREATLRRLNGQRGKRAIERRQVDPEDVFDAEFWQAETVDFSTGLYDAVFELGGSRVADLFGLDFSMSAPYVTDAIQARANQLAGQVTDTTYQAIKDALAEGVSEGEGIPDLAARIQGVFDQADSYRATTIARTEVLGAYNESSTVTAKELGGDVVGGKEWIAELDSATRDDHAEADGQVVGIEEAFDVGGEMLDYPGDGGPDNSINCRCTCGFLTPDEMSTRRKRTIGIRAAERHLALVQLGKAQPREVAV